MLGTDELEQRVGARLTVWVGSVALALAGAYLVRYSFERGWLSPAVRVALGLAFGVGLLAFGEWMRSRSARVSQGLSAAGIADLFASLLAGVHLYHLIPMALGFALMAMTTAAAVLLALRQGPAIALLGLVGGFLTPAFFGSPEPRPGPLFGYLLLLQAGLIVVTRRGRWWWIAGLNLLGGMGWVALWLRMQYRPGHGGWIGLFLLASVAAFVAAARPGAPGRSGTGPAREERILALAGAGIGLILCGALVGTSGFAPLEWTFMGLLGAGCLVLGRLDRGYEGLPWVAAVAGLSLLSWWKFAGQPGGIQRFTWVCLALGALYALGSYLCLWGAPRPARWASLSVVAAIGHLLVAYLRLDPHRPDAPWGALCLVLAALYTAGALPLALRRARGATGATSAAGAAGGVGSSAGAGGEHTLAALAIGVTGLVSLAIPIELERAWITVAWALEVPAVAWLYGRLRVRELQVVAAALAGAVAVRLLLNPMVLYYPAGSMPVLNWLLYGYGIPAVALAAAAILFRRSGGDWLAEWLEGGAIAVGWALITLEVRHYFHPEGLARGGVEWIEWGTLSVGWLLYALLLLAAAPRWQGWVPAAAAEILTWLAAVQSLLTQGLADNPLWEAHAVGSLPVVNWLLLVYGAPAALLAWAAHRLSQRGARPAALAAGSAALLLLFILVTLEVRQAFQGPILRGGATTNAEWYTYSFAWIVFGTFLLIAGIAGRSPILRRASLGVMLLAVGKVFLFDTAHLKDLFRVFSLLGLGASLLLLGYLYQRFVSRREAS
jgi:uncharacterized membrane protein